MLTKKDQLEAIIRVLGVYIPTHELPEERQARVARHILEAITPKGIAKHKAYTTHK